MWTPAFAFFGLLLSPRSLAPQVQLGHTSVVGREIPSLKQDFFGGIPYAKPPVGSLRLRPPVLQTKLKDGSFDASKYGFACPQLDLEYLPSSKQSEDCLTINIIRPSGTLPNASLPVLFWTYGGSFVSGAGSLYNGAALVAESVSRGTPIIYVNFNYRIGPLGFPQGNEADKAGILNLGLKDQLAALEWVQRNIGAFGGDKHKVTAFGESAGAIMTSILYLNSPLRKLARGAILQSGSAASGGIFKASHREETWQDFVASVPTCASRAKTGHTLDCLRKANSADVAEAVRISVKNSTWLAPVAPTFDGLHGLIPELPSKTLAKGNFAHVPFITGTTLDEGTVFISRTINSTEGVRDVVTRNFSPPGNTMDKLLEIYPNDPTVGSPYNTGRETFGLESEYKQASAIVGDLVFQSQRRAWNNAASDAGVTSFAYQFTEAQPDALPKGLGVYHGSEVAFLYREQLSWLPISSLNASQSAMDLSKVMMDYWLSFATSLSPNDGHGSQRPLWTPYTKNNAVLMQLDGEDLRLTADDYRSEQMGYINSDPYAFHH